MRSRVTRFKRQPRFSDTLQHFSKTLLLFYETARSFELLWGTLHVSDTAPRCSNTALRISEKASFLKSLRSAQGL